MRRMICVGVIALAAGQAWAGSDVSEYFPTLDAVSTEPATKSSSDAVPMKYTLYWENDGGWIKPVSKQDRHYTNGLAMSLTARPKWARDLGEWLPSFGNEFAAGTTDRRYAVGFIAVQGMYTPTNYELRAPDPTDEPYAGYLYGGFYLQRAHYFEKPDGQHGSGWQTASYEHIELDLGVVGPAALSKQAQEFIHSTFNYTRPRGWQYQLHDEPALDVKYVRKWRLTLVEPAAQSFQIIPELGVTAGSVHREASAGATFRVVYASGIADIPDDFGATRMHLPGAFMGDELTGWNLTLFGRPSARFVEHNTLIEGNTWRSSYVTQDIEPVVGEFQVGVTAQFCKCVELGYSWTFKTPEFDGQKAWDSYGAWTVSFVWGF